VCVIHNFAVAIVNWKLGALRCRPPPPLLYGEVFYNCAGTSSPFLPHPRLGQVVCQESDPTSIDCQSSATTKLLSCAIGFTHSFGTRDFKHIEFRSTSLQRFARTDPESCLAKMVCPMSTRNVSGLQLALGLELIKSNKLM